MSAEGTRAVAGRVLTGSTPLVQVAAALGRVLDIAPGTLRPDSPLAGIGCDSVAVIAFVDVLAEDAGIALDNGGADIDEALLAAQTVGDLVELVESAISLPAVVAE